jgi:hypothetical protein
MLICKTGSSIWTKCVCYASATLWTRFVIICDFVCCKWISKLLMKCNVWCVMLNDAILVVNELVWNPLWFRLTTGIIWAQVRKFERFGACFCTCDLIIWSVLLQSWSRLWALNESCSSVHALQIMFLDRELNLLGDKSNHASKFESTAVCFRLGNI